VFFSGLYQILNYWCIRMKRFHLLAIGGVCQSVGTFASQLALAKTGFSGPVALVFGWIAGQGLGIVILGGQTANDYRESLKVSFHWAALRAGFLKYKNFPIYNTPYIFAQTLAGQLLFLALRLFASVHVVGLFSMARKAVYAPVTLLSSSMRPVFYEKATVELKSGRLEPFVLKILKLQVLVGTPALVAFVFAAKPIFRFVLGNVWTEVGAYAAMLAFLAYMDFVTTWMDRIFDVQGRQRVALAWELLRDIVVVGGLVIALVLTHNPLLSVGAYVALEFLCSAGWVVVAFKIANFSMTSFWEVGRLCLGSGGIAAALVWAVQMLFRPS